MGSRNLLDSIASKPPERERRPAAANIRYHIIASTWHYYRFYFGLSLEDSVDCAKMAIMQAIAALGVKLPGAKSAAWTSGGRG